MPEDYDREYRTPVRKSAQVRLGLDHEQGEVTRFVVQLEYRHNETWHEVVRYDHAPQSEHGHDVKADGLHIDVYRDGKKYRTDYVAPPMPPGVALDFAEDHLAENIERFLRRFEEWHGIKSR